MREYKEGEKIFIKMNILDKEPVKHALYEYDNKRILVDVTHENIEQDDQYGIGVMTTDGKECQIFIPTSLIWRDALKFEIESPIKGIIKTVRAKRKV